MAMSEEEKKLTAYHEAGHALVGLLVPAGIPVHKATIIPRGRALGMVKFLPEGDRYSTKFIEYTSQLTVAMGGRVAEELVFGKENITSGAVGDIQQATQIARAMVTRMGYSDELGTVMYGDNQEEVFLGMSMQKNQSISEATAQKIDAEVRRLVSEAYETARNMVSEKRDVLEAFAQALLEYETVTGDELKSIMDGGSIDRPDDDQEVGIGPTGSAVPAAGAARPSRGPEEPDTGGMEPQPT